MVLEQCKSIDRMWLQTQIDEEMLQLAIEKHDLLNDKEYIDLQNESRQKVIEFYGMGGL